MTLLRNRLNVSSVNIGAVDALEDRVMFGSGPETTGKETSRPHT